MSKGARIGLPFRIRAPIALDESSDVVDGNRLPDRGVELAYDHAGRARDELDEIALQFVRLWSRCGVQIHRSVRDHGDRTRTAEFVETRADMLHQELGLLSSFVIEHGSLAQDTRASPSLATAGPRVYALTCAREAATTVERQR